MDPLLRARLWKYLTQLTGPGSCTSVLITTHYIDEAAQAHVVGMMRHGHLLAEEPPLQLMQRHNMSTLEDVFLQLCRGGRGSPDLDEEIPGQRPALTNDRQASGIADGLVSAERSVNTENGHSPVAYGNIVTRTDSGDYANGGLSNGRHPSSSERAPLIPRDDQKPVRNIFEGWFWQLKILKKRPLVCNRCLHSKDLQLDCFPLC